MGNYRIVGKGYGADPTLPQSAPPLDCYPKEGGPAFPFHIASLAPEGGISTFFGMSRRDYFAGQALVSMETWSPGPYTGDDDLSSPKRLQARAKWCVEQADALIAELKKGQ